MAAHFQAEKEKAAAPAQQQLIFKDEERCGCCSKKIELLNLLAHLAPDCRMLIIPLGGKSSDWNEHFAEVHEKKKDICLIKIVQENIKLR